MDEPSDGAGATLTLAVAVDTAAAAAIEGPQDMYELGPDQQVSAAQAPDLYPSRPAEGLGQQPARVPVDVITNVDLATETVRPAFSIRWMKRVWKRG